MQLQIGDKIADGSVVVHDEDRLCYQVYSTAKGVTGLRTISKALLDEWVSEVQAHPSYTSDQLRKALSGKTKIDKFEYGYASTLKKMAEMVLGIAPVIHAAPDFSEAFCKWFAENRGNGNDTTAKKYLAYFKTLTDAYQEPTHSYWHGLYKVMFGHDAAKEVAAIGELEEFEKIYGAILPALEKKTVSGDLDSVGSQKAIDWFWQPVVKPHTCVTSALKAYRDFLQWRETLKGDTDKSSSADILSVALRSFAAARKEEAWCAEKVGGDATKPGMGWRANGELRKSLPMTNNLKNDTHVKDWFKDLVRPDGKAWLDGVDTTGCAAWGATIDGLVKGGAMGTIASTGSGAAGSGAPGGRPLPRRIAAAVRAVAHPDTECFYDANVFEALKFLGLADGTFSEDFTDDDYAVAKGAQAVLKRRLKSEPRKYIWDTTATPPCAKPDTAPPDYLTVNEFLWWVKENQLKIEKQVQEGNMKPAVHKDLDVAQKNKKPKVNLKDSDDVLLLRLRAALRTKPFAILAGHSGTGKSRMVRKLAYMTCNDAALRYAVDDSGNFKTDAAGKPIPLKEPGNFCMVQVKPNWHDSSDLLGYYSELGKRYRSTDFVEFICKAYAYPNTPFFVCLDEMNLAPVEQYFAEYLSAIESRKLTQVTIKEGSPLADKVVDGVVTDELLAKAAYTKRDETTEAIMYDWLGCTLEESKHWLKTYGLTIPRNLFVVGTVNMDESTNQFSRKVLDRAMTIEMTDADFDNFGAKSPELKFDDEYMGDDAVAEMLKGSVQAAALTADQKTNLNNLKEVLAPTSFAVAYRFANEYALYEESLTKTVAASRDANGTAALTLPAAAAATGAAAATAVATPAAAPAATATTVTLTPAGTTAAAPSVPVKKDPAIPSAFDDMVLMKVLPRISGDENEVQQIFFKGRVEGKEGKRDAPAEKTLMKILDVTKDTDSLRKINMILDRGGSYLSFWP